MVVFHCKAVWLLSTAVHHVPQKVPTHLSVLEWPRAREAPGLEKLGMRRCEPYRRLMKQSLEPERESPSSDSTPPSLPIDNSWHVSADTAQVFPGLISVTEQE